MQSPIPMKYLIANWKMHGDYSLVMDYTAGLRAAGPMSHVKVVICPPFTLLHAFVDLLGMSHVGIGGQDTSASDSGIRTGEISPQMLLEQRCGFVIVGHSERRQWHGEKDAEIGQKAEKTILAGLTPIYCVGETLPEREAGQSENVVGNQLETAIKLMKHFPDKPVLIAYEPVWAISSSAATPPASASDIAGMHASIYQQLKGHGLEKTPILYGGSMKPDNAAGILTLPHVDGGLVGGASLKAESFIAIAKAAQSLA